MKIIIVGRTGTGKTRLADAISEIGNLKLLKTTTTRQPRDAADKARYNFITKEEADKIGAKYLYTKIGEAEYFCSDEDLKACDVAILDPDGVQDITTLLPDEIIHVVYIRVNLGSDTAVAKYESYLEDRVKHADDPEEVRKALVDKRAAESDRFGNFEELLFDMVHPNGNKNLPKQKKIFLDERFHGRIVSVADFENDFDPDKLSAFAMSQVLIIRKFKNIKTIIQQCADLEILNQPMPGMVAMRADGTNEEILRPIEDCAYAVQQSPAAMTQIFNAWLTHDLNIGIPTELLPKLAATI